MKKIFTRMAVLAAALTVATQTMAQEKTDYTDLIVNADLTAAGGWNADGTKGIDGSGIVKCGSGSVFDFSQTIASLPAGQYKVTAHAAYRYSGSEQQEYDAMQTDVLTKYAKLYATVGENTVSTLVMNRYDGASATDYAGGSGSVQVNGLYVPNSSNAVKAWFAAGEYVNEVVFEVPADGSVTIGIAKSEAPEVGDYTVIGPWTLTRLGDVPAEEQLLDVTIDHKRAISQGYGASVAQVDFTETKAFLGVDELTTDMLRIENPDGELISDYAPFDGWFNTKGVAETWSNLNAEAEAADKAGICVKFFQAIPDGEFTICDMNGADVVGNTYTVRWRLVNGEKAVRYTINVTFTAPEAVELDIVDKGIATSVEYDVAEGEYTMKTAAISDDDVAAICQELGISDLAEATVYGYNPSTKELVKNHAPFDGWRAPNGDFHMWNGDGTVAPACVKIVDGATTDNGKTYYCYNRAGQTAQTVKCYWALANDTKAVLVEVDFIYTDVTTGIASVEGTKAGTKVYSLSGQEVRHAVKGVYIVRGKKVVIK